MAVAVIMEFEGATLEQYDQLLGRMGLSPGGSAPTDCLFHWVAATDSGARVTDVWRSQEAFDKFAAEKIGPISQQVGMPAPSSTSIQEVHNFLTPG